MAEDKRLEIYRRVGIEPGNWRPHYVVWELTLACDQPCTHCGSRAGEARPTEISTARAIEVVGELKAMGCKEIALIGGEAYLHPGFLDVVRAIKATNQIRPSMTTGGRSIDEKLAKQMAEAGLHTVSVSIDGLETTHDLMRASKGSFKSATNSLRLLKAAGIVTASNINLNRLNHGDLEELYEVLKGLGISAWQVQITVPLGRASDRAAMLLQPWDLTTLVPRIVALKKRAFDEARIILQPANNLGYFGPEETTLRSPLPHQKDHWMGCMAGRLVMGIESDGAVKGCPSLQTDGYVGGNLHDKSIKEIWDTAPELSFTRKRTVEDLWGFCRTCPFAETCLAGCTFSSHAVLGRPGNNPYCHFRARTLKARGIRERLVLAEAAPGKPFDNGRFEIREEPFDAPDPKPPTPRDLVKVRRPEPV